MIAKCYKNYIIPWISYKKFYKLSSLKKEKVNVLITSKKLNVAQNGSLCFHPRKEVSLILEVWSEFCLLYPHTKCFYFHGSFSYYEISFCMCHKNCSPEMFPFKYRGSLWACNYMQVPFTSQAEMGAGFCPWAVLILAIILTKFLEKKHSEIH